MRVPVDNGLVLDVPGTVCISQRVDALLQVKIRWADASNHDSPAVAPQGIL